MFILLHNLHITLQIKKPTAGPIPPSRAQTSCKPTVRNMCLSPSSLGSPQRLCIAFSSYRPPVSSNLEQFLSLPLCFEASTVSESMGLTFPKMTLNPGPLDVFLVAFRSCLDRKTTEMMLWNFSALCPEAHGGDSSHPRDVNVGSWSCWCLPGFSTLNLSLPFCHWWVCCLGSC